MATRSELSAIVKSKIDELTPFDGGLALITAPGNLANNPVETYIDQFLDESAKETLLEAPAHVLPMEIFPTVTYDLPNKKATISIPADYLRVGSILFTSWARPVYNATYPSDPNYLKQFNPFLRAGKARPKATWISVGGAGKLVCYGVESATGNDLLYVALLLAEDMPNILVDAFTWHCVFQVLQVFDKEKLSQMAYGRYVKALSIL
jgi:hypothetical protein